MKKRIVLSACTLLSAFAAVAMPSRAELKKVQSTVNELMADDIAAMKSGKQTPEGAAAKAEELAELATDEASKFLLYKGAFGLYVQGGKYEEAVAALDRLTAAVKGVPDKVLSDIMREKLKRIPRKDGGVIFDLYERIDRRQRFAGEIAALEKKLKESPDDKSARQHLAVRLAQTDKWPEALGEFEKLRGKEADAGKAEASDPAAAADFWWTYQADEEGADVFRAHAAELYRKAVDGGKLTGLRLALARKRVAEVGGAANAGGGPAEADTPRQAAAPAKGEAEPEKAAPPPSKPGETNVAKGAYKTHFPVIRSSKDLELPKSFKSGQKFVDLDFGGTCEAMSFTAIAPGQSVIPVAFRDGKGWEGLPDSVKITLTRPFWLAQFPVTVGQAQFAGAFGNEQGPMKQKAVQKILSAVGGDENILVPCSFINVENAQEVYGFLNRSYGRLLPKGMVFRAPTMAEMAVAGSFAQLQIEMNSAFSKDVIPYLKPKGLFTDFNPPQGIGRDRMQRYIEYCYKEFAGRFFPVLNPDVYRKGKAIACFLSDIGLDRVEVPVLASVRSPYLTRDQVEGLVRSMKLQKAMKDPFWYAGEESSAVRYYNGGGRTLCGWGNLLSGLPHTMRVVIGPDYVSEWKAKNAR